METALVYLPFVGWILAAASFLLSTVLGIVLTYHWFRYAMNPGAAVFALALYAGISGTLLAAMITALVIGTA